MKKFLIGDLAKEAGVSIETIRYYQREGLLDEPSKPEGGYRRYDSSYIERIHLIRQLKALGFALKEVRQWLGAYPVPGHQECGALNAQVSKKLAEIQKVLADLQARVVLMQKYEKLCASCPPPPPARTSCPLFQHIHRGASS